MRTIIIEKQLNLHEKSHKFDEQEIFLENLDLTRNKMTDTGWRYQKHIYQEENMFGYHTENHDLVYYKYQPFNYDVYDKEDLDYNDPDYAGTKYKLADCYFRIFPN